MSAQAVLQPKQKIRGHLPPQTATSEEPQISADAGEAQFATVSIPDLRRSRSHSETAKFRFDGAHQPLYKDSIPTVVIPEQMPESDDETESNTQFDAKALRTSSNLESIRRSIEKSADDIAKNGKRSLTKDIQEVEKAIRQMVPKPAGLGRVLSESCYLKSLDVVETSVEPIVELIVERGQVGGAGLIMFSCSESNSQLPLTVGSVAVSLQSQTGGRILVIDSDLVGKSISHEFRRDRVAGLTDHGKNLAWPRAVTRTSNDKIDFLAAGQTQLGTEEQLQSVLNIVIPNLANDYDYVLVSVGDAHGLAASMWSKYTNGSYLLVSQRKSNQAVAKSAVAQLNSFGARLIGCIVSDCDE